jgi:hypothetical protein
MNRKIVTAFLLSISLSGTAQADGIAAAGPVSFIHPVAEKPTVLKRKAAIKLSPNPSTNGTVQVVSNMKGKLHFYVFDAQGTLLHQAVINGKEKHAITNLKKGIYLYDAFYNDEGIEHGKLIIK